MIIGVPKEIKTGEYRVGLLPSGARALIQVGHQVLIQTSAGHGAKIFDQDYKRCGAEIVSDAGEVYRRAGLIVKVKEPQLLEVALLRKTQIIFAYLHLAANHQLTEALLHSGCTAIAYETLEVNGQLPLLTPMSEIAGRMSVQEGAKYLEAPQGGRGILLGGVPGVKPAEVLILGGGVVGSNAAKIAAGMGAQVYLLDTNIDRLRHLSDVMPANVTVLFSDRNTILDRIQTADLVIGAVLVPGAKAPQLISRNDLQLIKSGSVIVDVAVDQGGCVETSYPTTHSEPTFIVDAVLHYCVANMPGAVPLTSTPALCNATLPWILKIANRESIPDGATNICDGIVTNEAVARTFGSL